MSISGTNKPGIDLRHAVSIDNVMWESTTRTSPRPDPDSWKFVERSLAGVPAEERQKMLYANAQALYRL